MTRAVFQSRMPRRVIEAKWDGFRDAFKGFDPKKVARFTPKDIDRLAEDARIVRNRKKIEATVANARTLLELDEAHGGFKRFLRSHGGFEETVKELRKHFKFLGDLGAYYFLWVVSEPVPSYEKWSRSRGMTPKKRTARRS
jgi:3-methyladenine DNA glycosylase Tag